MFHVPRVNIHLEVAHPEVWGVLSFGARVDPADLLAVVLHQLLRALRLLQQLLRLRLAEGRHVIVPVENQVNCVQSNSRTNLLGSFVVETMEVNGMNVIYKIRQFLVHFLKRKEKMKFRNTPFQHPYVHTCFFSLLASSFVLCTWLFMDDNFWETFWNWICQCVNFWQLAYVIADSKLGVLRVLAQNYL